MEAAREVFLALEGMGAGRTAEALDKWVLEPLAAMAKVAAQAERAEKRATAARAKEEPEKEAKEEEA